MCCTVYLVQHTGKYRMVQKAFCNAGEVWKDQMGSSDLTHPAEC